MEIHDYMDSIRTRYKNMVKPILGSGDNLAIQGELLDIVTLIKGRRREIMGGDSLWYRCGWVRWTSRKRNFKRENTIQKSNSKF